MCRQRTAASARFVADGVVLGLLAVSITSGLGVTILHRWSTSWSLVTVAPVRAQDGALDVDDFYPPSGRIGMVGGGLIADGGLTAPDGMAIALSRGGY